jgi:hypothetical protein
LPNIISLQNPDQILLIEWIILVSLRTQLSSLLVKFREKTDSFSQKYHSHSWKSIRLTDKTCHKAFKTYGMDGNEGAQVADNFDGS